MMVCCVQTCAVCASMESKHKGLKYKFICASGLKPQKLHAVDNLTFPTPFLAGAGSVLLDG